MARLLPRMLVAATALALLLAPSATAAKKRLTIRGAGFGHGVGMSQYGAQGFALNGSDYRSILAHYYTGTGIGDIGRRTVRVLLQDARGAARFTNARRAGGRRVDPSRTYGVRRGPSGTVELLSPRGRRLKRVSTPLVVTGTRNSPPVLEGRALNGRSDGAYRGRLEFRPDTYLGVLAVNAVSLEDYIRGVVGDEMPPSWHPEALKAQAVAARTYAVTTSKAGLGWEHYPDTRSQVYGGVAAEEPTVDAAVAATRGEVVTYEGEPVVTYFFSTSGGRTENVENTPLGHEPQPWLKSVEDPYDDISPRHRWGPIRMSLGRARRKLSGLVKGSFRGIKVRRRGRSPRIVQAQIIGSGGRTDVDGATLRARLGLYDTWAFFTSISTRRRRADGDETPARTDSSGGASPTARAASELGTRITGRVFPVRGEVVVQRRGRDRRWRRVGVAETGRGGRYSFTIPSEGRYRVRYRGAAGPVLRVR